MEQKIFDYLKERGIEEKVSWFYHRPLDGMTKLYRQTEMMLAASTIKVPVVMAWIDLIEAKKARWDTPLCYQERHFEPSDGIALYDRYRYGDFVPLEECMELAIVESDNPSNHMMREAFQQVANVSFRQWFAAFSPRPVDAAFLTSNSTNAEIMLEVMKRLYANQEKYARLIAWMKIAAQGRYIQSNHFEFEVAQKYGEIDCYEHAIGILFQPSPSLIGIFTELAGDQAKQTIRDLSKIMADEEKNG